MDAIAACARAAAVTLPQRADHDHRCAAWQSAAGQRIGSYHGADAAGAIVHGHPEAVRERGGRPDGRAGDGDPHPFERFTGRARRSGEWHGQLERLAPAQIRLRKPDGALAVAARDGAAGLNLRPSRPGGNGRIVEIERDPAGGVLDEPAAAAFEPAERGRQDAFDGDLDIVLQQPGIGDGGDGRFRARHGRCLGRW